LVGYQHSVIGAQMYNYGYRSNPDGLSSIPDLILAAGPATAKALAGLGYPKERIKIGGARRLKTFEKLPFDPDAPIYVALPFDRDISREMLVSLERLTGGEKKFLVKPHPMTPQDFRESDRVHRTTKPLVAAGPLSGVFYAATTVGLEAYLAGLPTVRFLPSSKVAANIFPTGADVVSATGETLSEDSFKQIVHRAMSYPDVFPEPDQHVWRGVIEG